jgi:hypothetical protein
MKKTLLAISAIAMSLAVQSQTVTGFIMSFDKDAPRNSNCLANFANGGGYQWADGNVASVAAYDPAKITYLTIKSKTTGLKPNLAPGGFDIYKVFGSGASAVCNNLRLSADPSNGLTETFIDLSNPANQKLSITAASVRENDTLNVFLTSSLDGGYPSSSSGNYGSGKGMVKQIILSTTMTTYFIDFTVNEAWEEPFANWADKNKINGYGFTFTTGAAPGGVATEVHLQDIKFGDEATGIITNTLSNASSVSVFPNPATDVVKVSYPTLAGKNITVSLSNGVSNVTTVSGGSTSTELNVSGLASGLYIVTVSADGAHVSTSKVFVK